ncbi:hypothetical protein N7462_010694 [Penicillium macrosclerotiorum]|uniref:uncharacterized protein n=1 Tax=Penicillium macrosclerotiorum TaxID=303699 RepID=UPI0025477E4E|nr:uncharacterized protein N7462_010694 [Penicillium macrosclerotiorum]KAJ5669624.1 hypothetical protein N7462_010694 [Penicillium macrosclerotiorum]
MSSQVGSCGLAEWSGDTAAHDSETPGKDETFFQGLHLPDYGLTHNAGYDPEHYTQAFYSPVPEAVKPSP